MSELLISLKVPPHLVPGMISLLTWSLLMTVGIIALFFMRLYLRSSVNKKVRSIKGSPAMSMMDIDQMRKRGLVNDEEFKSIRHALAEREVHTERRRKQTERERAILAEVEHDPDAARKLLAPELQTAHRETRVAPAPPPEPQATPAAQRPGRLQASPTWPATPAGALSGNNNAAARVARPASSAAPEPAAAPSNGGNGDKPGDLDVLLDKGAITLEEYDRLRAFFQ